MAHKTLCWECENACGKCSWSRDFTPVEGWSAKPTKILSNTTMLNEEGKIVCVPTFVDSFDVYDCPQFELLEAIKIKIAKMDRPKPRFLSSQNEIRRMYFEEKMNTQDIANKLGCSRRNIYYIIGKGENKKE